MGSRTRRQARAELKRAEKIANTVMVTVPCSHGPDNKHHVRVGLGHDDTVLFLESDCQRLGITDATRDVLKGLVGPKQYRSCTKITRAFTHHVHGQTLSNQDEYSRTSFFVLAPIITAIRDRAYSVMAKRRERSQDSDNAGEKPCTRHPYKGLYLPDAFASICSRVTTPHGWNLSLSVVPYNHTYMRARVHANVRLSITGSYTSGVAVARYIGGGRFLINSAELAEFAQVYPYPQNMHGQDSRRALCGACGILHTAIASHVRTQKHIKATESAVMNVLSQLNEMLNRKERSL